MNIFIVSWILVCATQAWADQVESSGEEGLAKLNMLPNWRYQRPNRYGDDAGSSFDNEQYRRKYVGDPRMQESADVVPDVKPNSDYNTRVEGNSLWKILRGMPFSVQSRSAASQPINAQQDADVSPNNVNFHPRYYGNDLNRLMDKRARRIG